MVVVILLLMCVCVCVCVCVNNIYSSVTVCIRKHESSLFQVTGKSVSFLRSRTSEQRQERSVAGDVRS